MGLFDSFNLTGNQPPSASLMSGGGFQLPQPQFQQVQDPRLQQQAPADPGRDMMMQFLQTLMSPPQQQGMGGLDLSAFLQPGGRHLGVGGAEISAQNPTGQRGLENGGFFSTPAQVQANLDSGKTTNVITPAMRQANNARPKTGFRMSGY